HIVAMDFNPNIKLEYCSLFPSVEYDFKAMLEIMEGMNETFYSLLAGWALPGGTLLVGVLEMYSQKMLRRLKEIGVEYEKHYVDHRMIRTTEPLFLLNVRRGARKDLSSSPISRPDLNRISGKTVRMTFHARDLAAVYLAPQPGRMLRPTVLMAPLSGDKASREILDLVIGGAFKGKYYMAGFSREFPRMRTIMKVSQAGAVEVDAYIQEKEHRSLLNDFWIMPRKVMTLKEFVILTYKTDQETEPKDYETELWDLINVLADSEESAGVDQIYYTITDPVLLPEKIALTEEAGSEDDRWDLVMKFPVVRDGGRSSSPLESRGLSPEAQKTFSLTPKGFWEDTAAVMLMEEMDIQPGQKVLSVGPGLDVRHLLYASMKGAVVDVNQPEYYVPAGMGSFQEHLVWLEKYLPAIKDDAARKVNIRAYPAPIQKAGIPSLFYDVVVILNVLDAAGLKEAERSEIAYEVARVIQDGGAVIVSSLGPIEESIDLLRTHAKYFGGDAVEIGRRGNVVALWLLKEQGREDLRQNRISSPVGLSLQETVKRDLESARKTGGLSIDYRYLMFYGTVKGAARRLSSEEIDAIPAAERASIDVILKEDNLEIFGIGLEERQVLFYLVHEKDDFKEHFLGCLYNGRILNDQGVREVYARIIEEHVKIDRILEKDRKYPSLLQGKKQELDDERHLLHKRAVALGQLTGRIEQKVHYDIMLAHGDLSAFGLPKIAMKPEGEKSVTILLPAYDGLHVVLADGSVSNGTFQKTVNDQTENAYQQFMKEIQDAVGEDGFAYDMVWQTGHKYWTKTFHMMGISTSRPQLSQLIARLQEFHKKNGKWFSSSPVLSGYSRERFSDKKDGFFGDTLRGLRELLQENAQKNSVDSTFYPDRIVFEKNIPAYLRNGSRGRLYIELGRLAVDENSKSDVLMSMKAEAGYTERSVEIRVISANGQRAFQVKVDRRARRLFPHSAVLFRSTVSYIESIRRLIEWDLYRADDDGYVRFSGSIVQALSAFLETAGKFTGREDKIDFAESREGATFIVPSPFVSSPIRSHKIFDPRESAIISSPVEEDQMADIHARNEQEKFKIYHSIGLLKQVDREIKVVFVMPMYKESARLRPSSSENPSGEDALRAKVEQNQYLHRINPLYQWQIIAVDDGTPGEASAKCVQELWSQIRGEHEAGGESLREDQVKTIIISPERKKVLGSYKGGAVLLGMRAAINDGWADYIGYTDVDVSTDLRQAGLLIDPLYTNEADAAIGSRWVPGGSSENVPFFRRLASRIYNLCVWMILPALRDIQDTHRGFKLFKKERLARILLYAKDKTVAFDTELLLLAKLCGYTIYEAPIAWFHSSQDSTMNILSQSWIHVYRFMKQRRHMFGLEREELKHLYRAFRKKEDIYVRKFLNVIEALIQKEEAGQDKKVLYGINGQPLRIVIDGDLFKSISFDSSREAYIDGYRNIMALDFTKRKKKLMYTVIVAPFFLDRWNHLHRFWPEAAQEFLFEKIRMNQKAAQKHFAVHEYIEKKKGLSIFRRDFKKINVGRDQVLHFKALLIWFEILLSPRYFQEHYTRTTLAWFYPQFARKDPEAMDLVLSFEKEYRTRIEKRSLPYLGTASDPEASQTPGEAGSPVAQVSFEKAERYLTAPAFQEIFFKTLRRSGLLRAARRDQYCMITSWLLGQLLIRRFDFSRFAVGESYLDVVLGLHDNNGMTGTIHYWLALRKVREPENALWIDGAYDQFEKRRQPEILVGPYAASLKDHHLVDMKSAFFGKAAEYFFNVTGSMFSEEQLVLLSGELVGRVGKEEKELIDFYRSYLRAEEFHKGDWPNLRPEIQRRAQKTLETLWAHPAARGSSPITEVSFETVQEYLADPVFEKTFFDALIQTGLLKESQRHLQYCVITTYLLSRLLSRRFGIPRLPLGGYYLDIVIGLHSDRNGLSTVHFWLALRKDGEKDALWIDAAYDQFTTRRKQSILTGPYDLSLEEHGLFEAKKIFFSVAQTHFSIATESEEAFSQQQLIALSQELSKQRHLDADQQGVVNLYQNYLLGEELSQGAWPGLDPKISRLMRRTYRLLLMHPATLVSSPIRLKHIIRPVVSAVCLGREQPTENILSWLYWLRQQIIIRLKWRRDGDLYYTFPNGSPYPFYIRPGVPTDFGSYKLLGHYYAEDHREGDPRAIIDCGADIGSTARYYLRRYPRAHLIAIEPDPQSFALLQKNLAFYRERVDLFNKAVWPDRAEVALEYKGYRGKSSWKTFVRDAREQDERVTTVTIGDIVRQFGLQSIDILKINIEGSERFLFSENYRSWLDITKNIVIDLHDRFWPGCSDIFFRALSDYNYELERRNNIALCRNISPKSGSPVKSDHKKVETLIKDIDAKFSDSVRRQDFSTASLCGAASFALARILSGQLGIPLFGKDPVRLEVAVAITITENGNIGRHYFVRFIKNNRKKLFIDPTLWQFDENRAGITVRTDYAAAVRDYALLESDRDVGDSLGRDDLLSEMLVHARREEDLFARGRFDFTEQENRIIETLIESAVSDSPIERHSKTGKYPTRESVLKALRERKAKGWENHPGALRNGEGQDTSLHYFSKKFKVKLPRIGKYPTKKSVHKALKERAAQGWPNHSRALQTGAHPDRSLYYSSKKFKVKLPQEPRGRPRKAKEPSLQAAHSKAARRVRSEGKKAQPKAEKKSVKRERRPSAYELMLSSGEKRPLFKTVHEPKVLEHNDLLMESREEEIRASGDLKEVVAGASLEEFETNLRAGNINDSLLEARINLAQAQKGRRIHDEKVLSKMDRLLEFSQDMVFLYAFDLWDGIKGILADREGFSGFVQTANPSDEKIGNIAAKMLLERMDQAKGPEADAMLRALLIMKSLGVITDALLVDEIGKRSVQPLPGDIGNTIEELRDIGMDYPMGYGYLRAREAILGLKKENKINGWRNSTNIGEVERLEAHVFTLLKELSKNPRGARTLKETLRVVEGEGKKFWLALVEHAKRQGLDEEREAKDIFSSLIKVAETYSPEYRTGLGGAGRPEGRSSHQEKRIDPRISGSPVAYELLSDQAGWPDKNESFLDLIERTFGSGQKLSLLDLGCGDNKAADRLAGMPQAQDLFRRIEGIDQRVGKLKGKTLGEHALLDYLGGRRAISFAKGRAGFKKITFEDAARHPQYKQQFDIVMINAPYPSDIEKSLDYADVFLRPNGKSMVFIRLESARETSDNDFFENHEKLDFELWRRGFKVKVFETLPGYPVSDWTSWDIAPIYAGYRRHGNKTGAVKRSSSPVEDEDIIRQIRTYRL
ncbi:MAG TPA: FkbM family methyltransferase, partial [Candidatus Omnitrophota bacterium]|nr:FkbM family methyltransferase [Candidatus Omnitrophota bacterium]